MQKLRMVIAAIVLVHFMMTGVSGNFYEPALAQTRPVPTEIYVPIDLNDSIVQLNFFLKPSDIDKIISGSEQDMAHYHLGLGIWMRNRWGFWRGSRLSNWFNARGIGHPGDMSGIILVSFWRHLNSKPVNLPAQIRYYKIYWKKAECKKKYPPIISSICFFFSK